MTDDHRYPDLKNKLFVVPVTYAVTARVYVLAHDAREAERKALDTDYDELLYLGDNLLQTNGEGRIEFDDYDVSSVDLTSIKLDTTSRDPREHPDWQSLPPTR